MFVFLWSCYRLKFREAWRRRVFIVKRGEYLADIIWRMLWWRPYSGGKSMLVRAQNRIVSSGWLRSLLLDPAHRRCILRMSLLWIIPGNPTAYFRHSLFLSSSLSSILLCFPPLIAFFLLRLPEKRQERQTLWTERYAIDSWKFASGLFRILLRRFTLEIHSDVISKGCCRDVFKIISSSLYSESKLNIVLIQISVLNFAETTLSNEN